MPRITFVQPDGSRLTLEAGHELTVMHVAIRHNLPGMPAECGGQLACGTCMVDLDLALADHVPPAGPDERDMIEDALGHLPPRRRLACQIVVSEALDGLVVHVPRRQG